MTKPEYITGMYITAETPDGVQRLVSKDTYFADSARKLRNLRNEFMLPLRLFYEDGTLCASIGVKNGSNDGSIVWEKETVASSSEKCYRLPDLGKLSISDARTVMMHELLHLQARAEVTWADFSGFPTNETIDAKINEVFKQDMAAAFAWTSLEDYEFDQDEETELPVPQNHMKVYDSQGYEFSGTIVEQNTSQLYVEVPNHGYVRFENGSLTDRTGDWTRRTSE